MIDYFGIKLNDASSMVALSPGVRDDFVDALHIDLQDVLDQGEHAVGKAILLSDSASSPTTRTELFDDHLWVSDVTQVNQFTTINPGEIYIESTRSSGGYNLFYTNGTNLDISAHDSNDALLDFFGLYPNSATKVSMSSGVRSAFINALDIGLNDVLAHGTDGVDKNFTLLGSNVWFNILSNWPNPTKQMQGSPGAIWLEDKTNGNETSVDLRAGSIWISKNLSASLRTVFSVNNGEFSFEIQTNGVATDFFGFNLQSASVWMSGNIQTAFRAALGI